MKINPNHVMWSAPDVERGDRPLLVMLHGHRWNERVGFELRHHLPAELVGASVRGPRQVGGGYAWFALDATLSLGAIEDSATAVLHWLWTASTGAGPSASSDSPREWRRHSRRRGSADPVIPAMLVDPTRAWLFQNTDLTERVYPGLGHNVSVTELNDRSAFIRGRLPAAS